MDLAVGRISTLLVDNSDAQPVIASALATSSVIKAVSFYNCINMAGGLQQLKSLFSLKTLKYANVIKTGVSGVKKELLNNSLYSHIDNRPLPPSSPDYVIPIWNSFDIKC